MSDPKGPAPDPPKGDASALAVISVSGLEEIVDEPIAAPPSTPTVLEVPWYQGTVSLLAPGRNAAAAPRPAPVVPPPAPTIVPPPAPTIVPPPAPTILPRAAAASAASAAPARTDGSQRPWLVPGERVGHGGMSVVRRVLDQNLRRQAAVKVLDPQIAAAPGGRQRFLEEAQITAQLDHPNIPPVHDCWIGPGGEHCFTMKLVRGRTLARMLGERPPALRSEQELERLLQVFLKVCDAIAFAHSRGVIHRDLKPENIMVGTHGQVYVMDWGCALLMKGAVEGERVTLERDPAQSLDPPNCAVGTAGYMAPEQAHARSDLIDARTDVYLLGSILYETLTAKPPHCAPSMSEAILHSQRGEIEDPQVVAAPNRVPPELCRIAMRALSADPDARYQSVEELKEDVERSLSHGWWFATTTFAPGALIVKEGDAGDAAYIIARGTCEAFRTENGARVVLRQMGPGDAFGETAIFTSSPRSASVEALEEVTAIMITREALERAVSRQSWFGAIVRALAERFRAVDAELAEARRGG